MAACILSVDDSVSIREAVGTTLRGAGYRVIEASSGDEALQRIDPSVSLVISDLTMPGMDGLRLVRALRDTDLYRSLPILMLTTENREERKREMREAGATGWIVKPFEPEQLLAIVDEVLRSEE